MTCRATTFPGVTAFDRRVFGATDYRRAVRRGVVIGLGTVSAAGVAAGVVTVTAAWIMAVALGGAPHLKARPLLALQTVALQTAALTESSGRLVGTMIAGVPPSSGDSADAGPFRSAHAVKGDSERLAIAVSAAGDPADAAPFPSAHALKGDAERVAVLDAAVGDSGDAAPFPAADAVKGDAERVVLADAAAEVTGALPPPDRSSAPAHNTLSPPARPAARPQSAARRETARPPAKPILQQVADADPSSTASFSLFQKDGLSERASNNSAAPALPPLAYAAPSPPSVISNVFPKHLTPQPAGPATALPGADSRTAIYDIAAHTVYLPDGTRLEAHSGLGSRLDDPHYVNEKDRGPTPPNVYDLALREESFHGVRALRLNPVGDSKMFGRDGILAHTYMLGPSGQSFGCVSFKDYEAFLKAFERGAVDRLVVVPRLDSKTATLAATRS